MRIDLLDYMGNDLTVVNAARVSFDKTSELIDDKLQEKDQKLIRYLADHGHWTPFTHCHVSFRITMPIYVARQLAKHQVGGSVNEISRRYVDSSPVLDVPDEWRKRAENVKQGSSDELVKIDRAMEKYIVSTLVKTLELYDSLLLLGVCPEQARSVLPLCMETTWVWTGSLFFFARVCKQRLDAHAQKETKEVVLRIDRIMSALFPVCWKALLRERNEPEL